MSFEIDTGKKILDKIKEFEKLEKKIYTDTESWYDEALISKMVEMAKTIGNFKKNRIEFNHLDFKAINF